MILLSPGDNASVSVYLRRIEELARNLARYNLELSAESRADAAYIERYAGEVRRILTQRGVITGGLR